MKKTNKSLAITGVIAALYVVLTVPLGSLASASFINVRPAEALTILPMLMTEAIPGVAIGCVAANILTGAMPLDVVFGSVITLVAAFLTSKCKTPYIGAIPPILLNALFLPVIWVITGGGSYLIMAGSVLVTQSIWIYGLGLPLYFGVKKSNLLDKLYQD